METLKITDDLEIPLTEIDMRAIRSQGAGGQNVNKLSTAIHLRFDIRNSAALPQRLKDKLLSSADQRISSEGVIIIKSQEHRSQDRNRQAAMQRLSDLLADAMQEPKKRVPTRPSRKAKQKRLDDKSRRGELKRGRRKIVDD